MGAFLTIPSTIAKIWIQISCFIRTEWCIGILRADCKLFYLLNISISDTVISRSVLKIYSILHC